ncbi:MAG: ABC transporter permease [Christensenellaceae bacterium]|nr:ABC transporter permease [Christensenellaceae bacterium]
MNQLNLIKSSAFSRLNINFTRAFLIVFSIAIALICLTINGFVSYSVDEANLIQFSNTDKNTVTLDVGDSQINYKNVDTIGTYFSGCKYNFFNKYDIGVALIGQHYYTFAAVEVGKLQKKMLLPSVDQYGATEKTRLIGGRLIDENDVTLGKNSILIHKTIGKYVFGETSDLLGEKIKLYDKDYNTAVYEVVGVLEDTPDIKRTVNILTRNSGLFLSNNYTLPIVLSGKYAEKVSDILLFFDGSINISTIEKMRTSLANSRFENTMITNVEEQILERNYSAPNSSEIADISLNIITVILCLTSVIIIFFSIKERASEIAVRKSFGATTYDILVMFLSEIIACIFIAICYALPISTMIMAVISKSVSARLYITIFPLNLDIFLFPIAVISLTVCVLSIIPITAFAKSKIVNCLKVS